MPDFFIRPLDTNDHDWVKQYMTKHWGSEITVAHDVVYHPSTLPGFVAHQNGKHVGLVTYALAGNSCEIVTLDSDLPSSGIGTALIEAVKAVAIKHRCRRLWLITTNDNLNALRFYQKRGFVLVAVHRNALERSRKVKPQIPLIGEHGIPLRDEIALEMILDNKA